MADTRKPAIAFATQVPLRPSKGIYPSVFAARVAGRERRALGDFFGLQNFGVNLTRLAPGSESALRHSHGKQDESRSNGGDELGRRGGQAAVVRRYQDIGTEFF